MKRLLVLLFISIVTSGCASGNLEVKSNESGDNIASSEMAYVLVCVASGGATEWRHTSTDYTAEWDNRKMLVSEPEYGFSALVGEKRYHFVQLTPGTYTLTDFWTTAGSATYTLNASAQQENETLKDKGGLIGSFGVEQGQINYLGSISAYISGNSIRISVKDEREEALEFLRKNYPNIAPADKLVPALVQRSR